MRRVHQDRLRTIIGIERTANATSTAIEDMGVDHSRAHIGVPEQLLHGADVIAILEQMGRERMAKRMASR